MEASPATQALYDGKYAGEVPSLDSSYLSGSRLRAFGGTTNLWLGYCRPLEAIDFERRDWVPESGWPFSRSVLDPYYDAASDFMKIGRFDTDNPDADRGRSYFESPNTSEKVFRFRSMRFGEVRSAELREARNVTVCLHANVLDLVASAEGTSVESVRVSTLSGKKSSVRARRWVIAAGGIENARLLLVSDGVHRGGLGNQHDLVGRYFMEHPVIYVGFGPAVFWERFPMSLYLQHDGVDRRANFVYPTEAIARREKLLTISMNFMWRANASGFSRTDQAVVAATRQVDAFQEDAEELRPPAWHKTTLVCECAPNPQSRVRLIAERDALGMRRVEVDWRLTGLEADTIHRYAKIMSRRIAELGMGRMKLAAEKHQLLGMMSAPHHHMGTTRMHDDPKQGVVDANCRVHGIENLYVAGSAVFPTSGAANPTFTILALALRLAEQLERDLGDR